MCMSLSVNSQTGESVHLSVPSFIRSSVYLPLSSVPSLPPVFPLICLSFYFSILPSVFQSVYPSALQCFRPSFNISIHNISPATLRSVSLFAQCRCVKRSCLASLSGIFCIIIQRHSRRHAALGGWPDGWLGGWLTGSRFGFWALLSFDLLWVRVFA